MSKNVAKTGSAWYESWHKTPGYENVLDVKKDAIDNADTVGQCLTLSKGHHRFTNIDTQQQPLFTLDSENCNKQRHTICKIEHAQEINNQGVPPQFPCISNSHRRRKRQIELKINGFGRLANL